MIRAQAGSRLSTATRIAGIDVARGSAIIGMLVAHAIPRASDAELLVDGRSSILFATLAGVSLGILTGSERPPERGNRADRVSGIVVRAMVLFVLGVLLGALDSDVAVILDFYAVMFVLMVPVLFLPRRMLGLIGLVLLVGVAVFRAATEGASPTEEPVAYLLQYYLLTGDYPALVYLPFLLAGLMSARSGLGRARTQLLMMASGTFAAVLGYGAAQLLPGVTAEAHSGFPAEVVGSGGLAIAFIGALLWLTAPERGKFGRALRAVLGPIGAAGSMALTLYTLQVLALAVFVALREANGAIEYPGWPLLVGMLLASLIFAMLWRRLLGKGPLERLLARLSRRDRSRRPPPHR